MLYRGTVGSVFPSSGPPFAAKCEKRSLRQQAPSSAKLVVRWIELNSCQDQCCRTRQASSIYRALSTPDGSLACLIYSANCMKPLDSSNYLQGKINLHYTCSTTDEMLFNTNLIRIILKIVELKVCFRNRDKNKQRSSKILMVINISRKHPNKVIDVPCLYLPHTEVLWVPLVVVLEYHTHLYSYDERRAIKYY